MPTGGPSMTLRVFLASPGDVPEERAYVREYLEAVLSKDPLLPRRVDFDVISWDDPHAGTPMPADLTPQEALLHYKGGPAGCDIVIVILAARLGTHLAIDRFTREDGSRYQSGTEWEYEDAWNADPRPAIMVYRRQDLAPPQFDDPRRDEKNRQFDLVRTFFERFKNPDGSAKGGFQSYSGVEDFKFRLANDLKHLVRERLASPEPPVERPPDAVPIVRPPRCFGRDDDIRALVTALDGDAPAALLVLGPGGIGKTTLTRQVATDPAVAKRFGPRRWFVELETTKDAATMQSAVVLATGHNAAATTFAQMLKSLAQQPCLVVLDNLETPWEQDQSAVQDALQMLATTPGVSLLASLRGAAAPASPRWTLRPTQLSPLDREEAKRLFLELAPGIAADDPHLVEFLKELGGLPLAVELVALRAAPDNDLRELWEEWQRRRVALITHPDLPLEQRRTSLARSLDLSWRSPRLRDEGRRLFRLLGQLPAGIADADRTALLGDAAAEAARQLRAVGLAFARDDRLDLLPPVREYARSMLPPDAPDFELWVSHYVILAREMGGQIFETAGAAALTRLSSELPNIEGALRAASSQLLGEAVNALGGVARLWLATGAGSPAIFVELADACRTAGDNRGAGRCWYHLGYVARGRSDHVQARAAYQRALPLCRDAEDTSFEAGCVEGLGDIARARSEHDAARAAYQQALPLYRQVGAVVGEANCIRRLGDIALARSEHDAARAAYQQALPLYRRVGAVLGEANCIRSLGDIALERSEHDAARAAYQQALPLYRQVGDVLGEANCIKSLGDIALERSEHDAARAAYQQALPLYRQVGAVLGEANCIKSLGDIALARSEHDAARAAYQQALPLYRQVGDVVGEANCITGLGDIALARSEHDAARAAYQEALPLYRQVGAVLGEANCIQGLGDTARADGDLPAAREHYEAALALYARISEPYSIGWAHHRLARLGDGAERAAHAAAAREAWTSIDRPDLVDSLDQFD